METTFVTAAYVWAHGKQPRGFGYWGFAYRRNPEAYETFWFNSTYGDAKRQAREKATADGQPVVYVLA